MAVSSNSAKNFIFCPPTPGKPDPTQQKPSVGHDTRNRVIQLGSKDNTCWLAAFNLLRERYKAPNTDDLPERKFELIVSTMRKELSAHDRSLPDVANQVNNDTIRNFFSKMTKEAIANPQTLEKLRTLDETCAPEVPLCTILPDFLKQEKYKNIYDYFVYLKIEKIQGIFENYFAKLNINPENLFERARQKDPITFSLFSEGKEWRDLGREKSILLDHLARNLIAEHYSIKVSSWHPKQPIEALIDNLHKHGPLIIGGCFGALQYAVPPRNLKKQIEGRAVYGWYKGDPVSSNPVIGHIVLIVGAEISAKVNVVYYIDPEDSSDPAHLEKQRIFCMSYSKLTSEKTICDNYGFRRNDAPESIGYAFYRDKTV